MQLAIIIVYMWLHYDKTRKVFLYFAFGNCIYWKSKNFECLYLAIWKIVYCDKIIMWNQCSEFDNCICWQFKSFECVNWARQISCLLRWNPDWKSIFARCLAGCVRLLWAKRFKVNPGDSPGFYWISRPNLQSYWSPRAATRTDLSLWTWVITHALLHRPQLDTVYCLVVLLRDLWRQH